MPIDWETLRQRAYRQCDLVTRAQCLSAGMSAEAVDWRVRSVKTAELAQELAARAGHRYSRILRPALTDVRAGGQSGAEVLYVRTGGHAAVAGRAAWSWADRPGVVRKICHVQTRRIFRRTGVRRGERGGVGPQVGSHAR